MLEAQQRGLSPRTLVDDRWVSTIAERLPDARAHIREYNERSDDEGFQLLRRAVDPRITG